MTLSEIKNILDAEVLCGEHLLGRKVKTAFACDLISEMLALANPNTLIITSLVNPHVIHTAEIMDAVGVIFVGGKKNGRRHNKKARPWKYTGSFNAFCNV